MLVFNVFVVISSLVNTLVSENITSCLTYMKYETLNETVQDRWYARLDLKYKEHLKGIWLTLVLNKKVDLLGTSFGVVTTDNNRDFMIKNEDYELENGSFLSIRIFVKYKNTPNPPVITSMYLDGRLICETEKNEAMQDEEEDTTKYEPEPPGPPLILSSNERKTTTLSSSLEEDDSQCGIISDIRSPIIINGQNTTHGQWPWHVAIKKRNSDLDPEYHYICGGSLISKIYVVTAAHCVCKKDTEELIKITYFSVHAGLHSLINVDSEVQSRRVTRMVVCPEYNPRKNYMDDIALLRLQEPVRITHIVRPVCLWEGSNNIEEMIGQIGTIPGYGLDESGRQSLYLMHALMPVTTFDKCSKTTGNSRSFCAGFANGTTICYGDSGGGLVFPRRSEDGEETVWYLRGIASNTAKHNNYCNPRQYAMFTDVAKHRHWLEKNMDDGY